MMLLKKQENASNKYMPIAYSLSTKIKNASFVAACMVVLIHVPHVFIPGDIGSAVEYFFVNGICRCAVPLFFVVSGYFLAQHFKECGWYKQEVAKRCKSLLVPYFIWCSVFAVVYMVFTGLSDYSHGLPVSNVQKELSIIRIFGLSPYVDPLSVQLWYLRFLFTLVLASPVLKFLLYRGKCCCVIVLFGLFVGNCFLPGMIPPSPLHTFFRHTFVFNGLFYFSVGMVIARYGASLRLYLSNKIGGAASLLGLSLVFLNTFCFYYDIQILVLESVVSTFANMFLLVALWVFVPAEDMIEGSVLLRMSFPIYLVHYSAIFVISKGFTVLLGVRGASSHFLRYIVVAALSFALTFLVVSILRRIVPVGGGFLWGGRTYA